VLCKALDGIPMVGCVDATAAMTPRLTLGYRTATAGAASFLAGTVVTGHEFHRTAVDPAAGPAPAWLHTDGTAEGFASAAVVASYLHLHPAGAPELALRLVERACG
jgi:cobyrinic acid a,c-diamide synthase